MQLKTLFLSVAILPLLGAGCISIGTTTAKPAVGGGIFKTADKGLTWVQKVAFPTEKGVQSLSGVDVTAFAFDPEDEKAMYLGTAATGLFFTYDGAESWQSANDISAGNVGAIAVDPKNKCTVYATVANKVLKTTDCSRTYKVVYTDQRPEATITSLVVDWYNSNQLYLGNATGDVAKSADGGATWSSVYHWDDSIGGIIVSAADSRTIWVATKNSGMQLSEDGGTTWQDLRKGTDEFDGARAFFAMAEDQSAPGTLLVASRYGLLESSDKGKTWQKMTLLTPPQTITITTLAVNPKNGREIYYTTASKLYKSKDGGSTWSTADLPTTRVASLLVVNPHDDTTLFLGVTAPKK